MTPLLSVDDFRGLEGDVVVLDARPSPDAYAEGHVAGARHADLDTQLSGARDEGADPARGGRHPLPRLARWLEQLGSWGITPSTTVVVYDDQSGANAAARAWWMLRAVGHEKVAVLDGDFRSLGLTTEMPSIAPQKPYPAPAWQRPVVSMDEVDALRNDPEWKVLDVRATPRFRGETEPIDPIAGHIPGAVNLPFAENLTAGRYKSADELRAQYERLLAGTRPDHLVVHCGSGVTACHTLLALEAAGMEGAALYVGSWSEWCRNDDRPRGTGDGER
ncbi:MAG TPA: sulfurtransferase [Thermoanaerobaculia bacterium]